MKNREPSADGDSGRDARGRFMAGNPGGKGNPYAVRVAALRGALLDAVTKKDLRQMVKAVVAKAKQGDAAAFRVIAPYLLGRPLLAEQVSEPEESRGPLVIVYGDEEGDQDEDKLDAEFGERYSGSSPDRGEPKP